MFKTFLKKRGEFKCVPVTAQIRRWDLRGGRSASTPRTVLCIRIDSLSFFGHCIDSTNIHVGTTYKALYKLIQPNVARKDPGQPVVCMPQPPLHHPLDL